MTAATLTTGKTRGCPVNPATDSQSSRPARRCINSRANRHRQGPPQKRIQSWRTLQRGTGRQFPGSAWGKERQLLQNSICPAMRHRLVRIRQVSQVSGQSMDRLVAAHQLVHDHRLISGARGDRELTDRACQEVDQPLPRSGNHLRCVRERNAAPQIIAHATFLAQLPLPGRPPTTTAAPQWPLPESP